MLSRSEARMCASAGGIGGERGGLFDVVFGGMCHPVGESGVGEDRSANAADEPVSGLGNDGDSHPQSLAGGGAAVIREGVECDIDVFVVGQQFAVRRGAEQIDAVAVNALAGEGFPVAGASGRRRGWSFSG